MTGKRNHMAIWTMLRAWFGVSPAVAAVETLVPVLPAAGLQSGQAQWIKISDFMSGAGRSAARAVELQRSSAQQLNAASYALDILKSELAAAMTMKAPEPAFALLAPRGRPLRSNEHKSRLAA